MLSELDLYAFRDRKRPRLRGDGVASRRSERTCIFIDSCPQAVNRDEDVSNPESLSMKISVNHNHQGHLRSIHPSDPVDPVICVLFSMVDTSS